MIKINDILNFINPLKVIKGFIDSSTLSLSTAFSVGLGLVSSRKASKQAAAGQAAGLSQQQRSLEEQKRQYDIGQANLAPYREAGQRGLETYEQMLAQDQLPKWGGFGLDQYREDPGYQFRLSQGYQGLERMAARGGERFSGKLGIGLQDYGQRMAAQEFQAARGRSLQDYQLRRGEGIFRLGQYSNLASTGQQAAGAASNLGAQYAGSVSDINRGIAGYQSDIGKARAAGTLGIANTLTSGLAAYQYGRGYQQPAFGGYGSPYQSTWIGDTGATQAGMLVEQNAGFN